MLPKFLLLHLFRAEPQLSILGTIPAALLSILCLSHLVLTVSIHPFLASHISSNQNGFSWIVGSRISGKIHRGEWSEVLQFRWRAEVPPNLINHSLFARLLSSLSHIESPFLKKKFRSDFRIVGIYIPTDATIHLSLSLSLDFVKKNFNFGNCNNRKARYPTKYWLLSFNFLIKRCNSC